MPRKIHAVIILSLGLSALNLVGCATTYSAPTDPALSASVDVYKGYKTGVGFGTGTQQEYSVYTNDQCDTPQRLASFTWTNGEKKNKTVAANEPLRVGVSTNYFSPGSGGYWNGTAYITSTDVNRCISHAKFTPQPGASYKLVQTEGDNKSCDIEVIDLATSAPPTDLVTGFKNACTAYTPEEDS